MICPLHPSLGEQDECEACKAGSPPDLGVSVNETTETGEHFGE